MEVERAGVSQCQRSWRASGRMRTGLPEKRRRSCRSTLPVDRWFAAVRGLPSHRRCCCGCAWGLPSHAVGATCCCAIALLRYAAAPSDARDINSNKLSCMRSVVKIGS